MIRAELDKLTHELQNIPSEEALRVYVERINEAIFVLDGLGNTYAGGNDWYTFVTMTEADKRRLIDAVFSKPLPSGQPAGVYINPGPVPRRGLTRLLDLYDQGAA